MSAATIVFVNAADPVPTEPAGNDSTSPAANTNVESSTLLLMLVISFALAIITSTSKEPNVLTVLAVILYVAAT